MLNEELRYYIESRNGELSSDEILKVVDIARNPQLNHMNYENGKWQLWDVDGNYYEFKKRTW